MFKKWIGCCGGAVVAEWNCLSFNKGREEWSFEWTCSMESEVVNRQSFSPFCGVEVEFRVWVPWPQRGNTGSNDTLSIWDEWGDIDPAQNQPIECSLPAKSLPVAKTQGLPKSAQEFLFPWALPTEVDSRFDGRAHPLQSQHSFPIQWTKHCNPSFDQPCQTKTNKYNVESELAISVVYKGMHNELPWEGTETLNRIWNVIIVFGTQNLSRLLDIVGLSLPES